MSELIAVSANAAVSSSITLADGESATVTLVFPAGTINEAITAGIEMVNTAPAAPTAIGTLRAIPMAERAANLSGPGVFRIVKGAGQTYGVERS